MKRVFFIFLMMTMSVTIFVSGCNSSKKQIARDARAKEERERLDSDQRNFQRTFEREMNR